MALGVRRRLADAGDPGSLAARARRRRWAAFTAEFPELAGMRVLDLGGTTAFWRDVTPRPAELVLLNPGQEADAAAPWATVVTGDACDPPGAVRQRHFDLVYSNSTIEHVGGHTRRRAFAEVVTSFGSRAWIQTPYRYFPLEPHFVFPGFQHLPVAARSAIAARWPLMPPGFPADRCEALEELLEVELLSATEMRHYFPTADLRHERVAGLVKSLIAVL